METKYESAILLYTVSDIIGLKLSELTVGKDKFSPNTSLEMMYEFIALGGITSINMNNYYVSNNTMLLYGISKTLVDNDTLILGKNDEELINKIKINMTKIIENIYDDSKKDIDRALMLTTYENIFRDMRYVTYDPYTGGAGPATRSVGIGLAYYGEKNRDKLIYIAIESAKLTHNSPIGFLGAASSALLTAFAVENLHLYEWVFELLKILKSDSISKYIDKSNKNIVDDYNNYVGYWQKYIDLRFEDKKPIKSKAQINLIFRSRFHYDHFTKDTKGYIIGDSGYSSVIMAYDSLIDAENKWEKLIIYSAVHWGSSNSVASLAGAWYGLLYGFHNVPNNNLIGIEFQNDLTLLAKNLYKKFYK